MENAGAATATGAGAGCVAPIAASFCGISMFAAVVPSAPHTGQFTRHGIWPFTGSTSNLYFCPHWHVTLTSIMVSFLVPNYLVPPAMLLSVFGFQNAVSAANNFAPISFSNES